MGSIENPLPVEGDCFASDGDYLIPNVEMGSSRQLKIICIGAGASGLNLAFQARAHLRDVDLVIFEKNNEVGGTWYENRYGFTLSMTPACIVLTFQQVPRLCV